MVGSGEVEININEWLKTLLRVLSPRHVLTIGLEGKKINLP